MINGTRNVRDNRGGVKNPSRVTSGTLDMRSEMVLENWRTSSRHHVSGLHPNVSQNARFSAVGSFPGLWPEAKRASVTLCVVLLTIYEVSFKKFRNNDPFTHAQLVV
jgi:hypothetical protein